MFSLAYKDDAAWNESRWQNARFNELLLMAKAELDQEKRTAMYKEMQELARDDGGKIDDGGFHRGTFGIGSVRIRSVFHR